MELCVDFDVPDGCFFAPLRKNFKKVSIPHPLDNDIEGFFRILNEKIIPICSTYSSMPKFYGERVKKMLEHTIPGYDLCFTFPVELFYRLIVPKEEQTKENLELLQILRIIMEIYIAYQTIMDDIVDDSEIRRGKPCWHTICKGGKKAAFFDAVFLEKMVYHLLKFYFGNTPVYSKMIHAIIEAMALTSIGEVMELSESTNLLAGDFEILVTNPYKSGHTYKVQADFSLLHAGITDDEIISKVASVICELYICMQVWDDFIDIFSSTEATGKILCEDIVNGRPSWISQVAIAQFNDDQKKRFFKYYGSTDKKDIQTIKDLFGEINIPRLYLEYMKTANEKCDSIIQDISNANVQSACINVKEWLLGKF